MVKLLLRNGTMIHDVKNNIRFFHIPKNAGTSIEHWFRQHIDGCDILDGSDRHIGPTRGEKLWGKDDCWTFCVVRNPWDRMVSWYNYWKKLQKHDMPFESFILKAKEDPGSIYVNFLGGQHGVYFYVDHVIRYEQLDKQFEVIQEKTNCFEPLPRKNVSRSKPGYIKYYEHNWMIDVIKDRYKLEIDDLKYTFGG